MQALSASSGWWQKIRRNLQLFLRKQYPWVQLAGHAGGFVADVDPGWILKRANELEKVCLESGGGGVCVCACVHLSLLSYQDS